MKNLPQIVRVAPGQFTQVVQAAALHSIKENASFLLLFLLENICYGARLKHLTLTQRRIDVDATLST